MKPTPPSKGDVSDFSPPIFILSLFSYRFPLSTFISKSIPKINYPILYSHLDLQMNAIDVDCEDESRDSFSASIGKVLAAGTTFNSANVSKAQYKQIEKRKLRIKMLIDIAKLETKLKDCIETDFLDATFTSNDTEKQSYFAIKSSVPSIVRWTSMHDEALFKCNNVVPINELHPFVLTMIAPVEFLDLLLQSKDGIDFQHLSAHIRDLRQSLTNAKLCTNPFSLIVGLLGLQKAIKDKQTKVLI